MKRTNSWLHLIQPPVDSAIIRYFPVFICELDFYRNGSPTNCDSSLCCSAVWSRFKTFHNHYLCILYFSQCFPLALWTIERVIFQNGILSDLNLSRVLFPQTGHKIYPVFSFIIHFNINFSSIRLSCFWVFSLSGFTHNWKFCTAKNIWPKILS